MKDLTAQHKQERLNPEFIQGKIELIRQGLPINISEEELHVLEEDLKGARYFSVDMLRQFEDKKSSPGVEKEDIEHLFAAESKNLAEIEIALRKIDEFRAEHWSKIQNAA